VSRIKISIPEISVFTCEIPLTINFINYGGHMGNDAVLTICQDARIQYLNSMKYDELDFFGASLIQADAAIVYKGEGFHCDVLEVTLAIDEINDYGFDLYYQLRNKETQKEIARCKTGMVFFDYDKRKIQKCPSEFLVYYDRQSE
jgi:acyl-CoA thioester hydrolase